MSRFIKSFYYAVRGILVAFKEQSNLKIHVACIVAVVGAGFYFKIADTEWLAIVLAIGFVIVAEIFNTAIEYVVDLVSPQRQPTAGKIKDIAAGAVLIASITAAIVGFIIFKKYLF